MHALLEVGQDSFSRETLFTALITPHALFLLPPYSCILFLERERERGGDRQGRKKMRERRSRCNES